MGHHRDQVERRLLCSTLLPQRIAYAAMSRSSDIRSASLFTTASASSMLAMATSDQCVSLRRSCCGKIEQGRQHHGGEFGGDEIGPVEYLVARQAIEHGLGATADRRFHVGEVGKRDVVAVLRCAV